MKTIEQYVLEVSRDLNDQQQGREFQRWSRVLLVSYLNDALSEIIGYRPEALTDLLDIQLIPGYIQTLTEGRQLLGIDKNADGTLPIEADVDTLREWASACMPAPPLRVNAAGNPIFNIRSYGVDPKDPLKFYVSPVVPVGLAPTVSVTVTQLVPNYTVLDFGVAIDILPKYSNCIKDYMLYKAFSLNTESPEGKANASVSYAAFYQAMGVKYRMDSAFNGRNYGVNNGNSAR